MPSAYDGVAPIYDTWAAAMTEDVDFYVSLAEEADGPIVELAVGTGRVSIPIAQRTGKRVLGIDSSPAMLEIARERAATAGVELELREGDMRDFELDEPAALVICPFRSLLHLPTWADRRRVFERVAARSGPAAASPGTRSPSTIASRASSTATGATSRPGIATTTCPRTTASTLRSRPLGSRCGGSPASEWEGLLDVSGLETEALYGWFDRRPFDEESREFVWVARKPAA